MTFTVLPAPVVVDASVSVALALGEREELHHRWDAWLEARRLVLTPSLHWPEVGHALLRRLPDRPVEVARRLERLSELGIETADRGSRGAAMAVALAAQHGLSVYDATYLWLAIDTDAELATLDRALAAAATAEGVPLAIALD